MSGTEGNVMSTGTPHRPYSSPRAETCCTPIPPHLRPNHFRQRTATLASAFVNSGQLSNTDKWKLVWNIGGGDVDNIRHTRLRHLKEVFGFTKLLSKEELKLSSAVGNLSDFSHGYLTAMTRNWK